VKTSLRLAAGVCAALAALAVAGPVSAAYSPRLFVTAVDNGLARPTTMVLGHIQTAADDPTAKDTMYVPLGYQVNLAQTVGKTIGEVDGLAVYRDGSNTEQDFTGKVTVADPTAYPPGSNLCTPGEQHQAVWVLSVTIAGTAMTIPVYVDRTSGAEAAFSTAKLQLCLPGPIGTPRSAEILIALFDVTGVFSNPSARGYRLWRAEFTPYLPGTPNQNAAAAVEGQAFVPSSAVLTIRAKALRRGGVLITGRLLVQGAPFSGATVELYTGSRRVAAGRTNRTGRFSIRPRRIKRRTSYRALVTQVGNRPGGCATAAPPISALGCKTAMLSFIAVSNGVRVRPRR
jgi:hypothetical protein